MVSWRRHNPLAVDLAGLSGGAATLASAAARPAAGGIAARDRHVQSKYSVLHFTGVRDLIISRLRPIGLEVMQLDDSPQDLADRTTLHGFARAGRTGMSG